MELNLTLDYVSSRAGFSKPYLSTIETGKVKNPPSDELLRKLEEILQFETGILLKIAHFERLPADVRQQYESAEAQNIKLRKMIRNIVELKADHNQVRSMLSKEDICQEDKPEIVKAGTVVPIINKVAAGYPTDFTDLEYPVGVAEDYIRCPDLHDPNAFAVRVVGDSMEPKFVEGDIVVFSPAAEVHNGDDCFIRFSMPHETTFKRVFFENEGRVRLQPRNEKYAPIIVEGKRIDGIYRAFSRTERL
jgi:phage repressor protein C with HTH and peptisase S24 domain